jgi:hypothetical protein
MSLIGKKTKGKEGIIAYNTLFGISVMKRHVEFEHLELLIVFLEKIALTDNIYESQTMATNANEGYRVM